MYKKILLLIITLFMACIWMAGAANAATSNLFNGPPRLVRVEKSHSRLVKLSGIPKRISVADSSVADIVAIAPDQLYIRGRKVGKTNITIWDKKNRVMANYHVHVGRNLTLLKKMLHKLLPNERVAVHEMEGVVVLSGRVSTKKARLQAESLASIFSKGGEDKENKTSAMGSASTKKKDGDDSDKKASSNPSAMLANAFTQALSGGSKSKGGTTVRNLIEVGDQKQVLIKLKIAEVNKGALKKHSISLNALGNSGFLFTFLGGGLLPLPTQTYTPFFPFEGVPSQELSGIAKYQANDSTALLGFIDILKGDGLVQVLAEPNLSCLSGEKASFLAGGEFPVPVPQDRSITIYFKPYGVQLAFQPTVLNDGRIQLSVEPEVSEMDFSNAVNVGGFVVPGLVTRRAKTKLELANGQSFALAGLLKKNLSKEMEKFPWLGDVPVLGQLFRSQRYQNDESELLIICTPEIVVTNPGHEILDPNSFKEPSDLDFYITSKYEAIKPYADPGKGGPLKPSRSAQASYQTMSKGNMKMEGKFGHEVVY